MNDSEATTAETYVSTAPQTSALASGKGGGGNSGKDGDGKKKGDKSHPWRDNIEAIAISIITIVLFKYFVLEAYKIPTGSMQPTLMGNAETGIYDRVIVDKFSYHFRDPERFEIAVFKYPLDSSKNFIKRIVGMPEEELMLKGGDAWIRPKGETDFRVLRRSRAIQGAQLRRLETAGGWSTSREAGASWTIDSKSSGDLIIASGRGEATFPRTPIESIRDNYVDGYPEGMRGKIDSKNKGSNNNDVSDLRVRTRVTADAECREVAVVLQEGRRRFRFILPGPAAPEGERARIEILGLEGSELAGGLATVPAKGDHRLRTGKRIDLEVQNLNDLLSFRIGGEEVATVEIPPAADRSRAKVSLAVEAPNGSGAKLEKVRVWRDIYYTTDPTRQKVTRWQIPPGHYVVLGDNSQDSSDGRDWSLAQFRVLEGDAAGEVVRGNAREGLQVRADTNPLYLPNKRSWERVFLRDELGERHVFQKAEVERLADEIAPLVPRSLIRGRAVLVVWPLAPQHDVYRWKWVR